MAPSHIYLIRHGETEWSRSGRHTGLTDIDLTERGEEEARVLGHNLQGIAFSHVFSSPLRRSRRTCELSNLSPAAKIDINLSEWDYGQYEGLTSVEIHNRRPDWNLFRDGCPGGESPAQVSKRADQIIELLRSLENNVAVFSHGHFLRTLAVRWIGLPVENGRSLVLSTASLSSSGI